MRKFLWLLLFMLVPALGHAQALPYIVHTGASSAEFRMCSFPANGEPCTNYAQMYGDAAETDKLPSVYQSLQGGSILIYLAPGTYVLQVNGEPQYDEIIVYPSGGSGSGTVTSVGLSLPSFFTVTGSPVSTTGTLTGTYASGLSNNYVLGTNSSGTAGLYALNAFPASAFPTLNQNTTGTAANVTGVVAIANGGSGAATWGAYDLLFNNSSSATAPALIPFSSLPAAQFPILNQSTTGNAATATAPQSTPTPCSGSNLSQGIDSSFNAICTPVGGGVTVYTASQTLTSADNGHNDHFECTVSCTATLPSTIPTGGTSFVVGITADTGSSAITVTVDPNGVTWKICGTTSTTPFTIPVDQETLVVWTDGTDYYANCPLKPGAHTTITPGSTGQVVASTASAGGLLSAGNNDQTAAYTVTSSDDGKIIPVSCSSPCTVTLPTYSTLSTTFNTRVDNTGSTTVTLSSASTITGGLTLLPGMFSDIAIQSGTGYLSTRNTNTYTQAMSGTFETLTAPNNSGFSQTFTWPANLPTGTIAYFQWQTEYSETNTGEKATWYLQNATSGGIIWCPFDQLNLASGAGGLASAWSFGGTCQITILAGGATTTAYFGATGSDHVWAQNNSSGYTINGYCGFGCGTQGNTGSPGSAGQPYDGTVANTLSLIESNSTPGATFYLENASLVIVIPWNK